MRFPACLPVASIDMEAAVGGRERKGEEPGEMETEVPGVTRERDKTGAGTRRRVKGKSEGADRQLKYIPKKGEKWDRMYEWILVLMEYINGMVCWEFKTLRMIRVKLVLKVEAEIGERRNGISRRQEINK